MSTLNRYNGSKMSEMDEKLKVLVVDDEEGMREGIRRILKRKGGWLSIFGLQLFKATANHRILPLPVEVVAVTVVNNY